MFAVSTIYSTQSMRTFRHKMKLCILACDGLFLNVDVFSPLLGEGHPVVRFSYATINSYIMCDDHHKESESSSTESIIHLKGTWGAFPQRRRPTLIQASTFYLVKLVEDDDCDASVITIKWLSQELGILSSLSRRFHWTPNIDGMTNTITSITKVASEDIEVV